MSKSRELAEQLVEKLRPRLIDLVAELLEESGAGAGAADDAMPHRLPGVSEESYRKAADAVARWQSGGKGRRKAARQLH